MKVIRSGFLSVIFLFFLFFNQLTFAVTVSTLYEAEIPVPFQTDEAKETAIKDGLMQVLYKLSGDKEIINNPTIKSNLERADYYVEEWSFAPATTSEAEYIIKVKYNVADVNRLLSKAQVGFWGASRPLILVWLVITNPKVGSDMVGSENPSEIYQLMIRQSQRFGLPMIFPVMDVTDLDLVTSNDIASINLQTLSKASERYEADALLVGNIEVDEAVTQSQWQLIMGNDRYTWAISDKSSKSVILTIMRQLSQTLANKYIVNPNTKENWLLLEVKKIKEKDNLNQLTDYLKTLVTVKELELTQIKGDVVNFSLLVKGSLNNFKETTGIFHHLIYKNFDTKQNKMIYEWVD